MNKNVIPHIKGSCGYAGNGEEFQDKEEKVIQVDVTPVISKWSECSKRFVLAHGVTLMPKGKLTLKSEKVNEVAERIDKAHIESEEGTFKPTMDIDELNYALQSKEHHGCTCGYGNIPWKHALKSTTNSYRKKWRQYHDDDKLDYKELMAIM
jgi:hypothetical protein